MEPQKPIEPTNIPNNTEGGVVIEHNTQPPQPQVIRPSQPIEQPRPSAPLPQQTATQNTITPKPTVVAPPVIIQAPINPLPQPQPAVTAPPPPVVAQPIAPQPIAAPSPVAKIESVETDGQDNPDWQYHSGKLKTEYEDDDNSYKTDEAQKDPQNAGIIWSASEFVSHQKNSRWYMLLAVGAIVVSGILYLVTREIFSIVVVIILAIALGVFGAVKPKTLDYAVGDEGIQIGPKQFPYTTFHSFAVIDDAAIAYIQLLPQKRFMAPISIYFAPDDEKKIVDYLGEHLPLEHKKRDFTDKLASRIHF